MKILYHFRTRGTGAEGVHIAGIAEALEQLGHEVVFSSPTGINPRQSAGSNPFHSGRSSSLLSRLAAHAPRLVFELMEVGYNLVAAWRNFTLIRQHRFGLIYERHAFFLFSTAWLARRRNIPLVIEINELVGDERVRPDPILTPLARATDRFALRHASLVVVVSPHLQRRVIAMGVAPERVMVLPNAVREATLQATTHPDEIRRRHGCEGQLLIGFAGWFVPWHRLEGFLEVFASLAGLHPDLRFMLIGDGDLRASLADQAKALGVADKVIFTGAVTHAEMPNYLAALDIGLVPHSNAFRSPIKLFEYMAHACAVLAPHTEPIAMVVRDGENGLLFDPENQAHLREKLALLVTDGALRKRLGTMARRDVAQQHTWSRNAERVLGTLGRHSRPEAFEHLA